MLMEIRNMVDQSKTLFARRDVDFIGDLAPWVVVAFIALLTSGCWAVMRVGPGRRCASWSWNSIIGEVRSTDRWLESTLRDPSWRCLSCAGDEDSGLDMARTVTNANDNNWTSGAQVRVQ